MNSMYQKQGIIRFVQIVALISALLLERVVGLPIIFLGITLQTIDLTEKNMRKAVFLIAAVILSLVYQFSFLISFLIIGFGVVIWFGLQQFSSSKTARVVFSTLSMVALLVLYLDMTLTIRSSFYSLVSLVVIVAIARTTQKYT